MLVMLFVRRENVTWDSCFMDILQDQQQQDEHSENGWMTSEMIVLLWLKYRQKQ